MFTCDVLDDAMQTNKTRMSCLKTWLVQIGLVRVGTACNLDSYRTHLCANASHKYGLDLMFSCTHALVLILVYVRTRPIPAHKTLKGMAKPSMNCPATLHILSLTPHSNKCTWWALTLEESTVQWVRGCA